MTKDKKPPADPTALLRQDIIKTVDTEHGLTVFRHIMYICGYQSPSVVANSQTGEINIHSTVYNEARRNLWLTLRQYIPQDRLTLIEIQQTVGDDTNA